MIRPIGNSIIFEFLDNVEKGNFSNTTESGIIYKSFDVDTKSPRWGKVLAVGSSVELVKVGDEILIEPLRWTDGSKIDDQMVWRTTENDVIGIKED